MTKHQRARQSWLRNESGLIKCTNKIGKAQSFKNKISHLGYNRKMI